MEGCGQDEALNPCLPQDYVHQNRTLQFKIRGMQQKTCLTGADRKTEVGQRLDYMPPAQQESCFFFIGAQG